MTAVHTEQYKGYTIEIHLDEGAPQPDFSMLGHFLFPGGHDHIDLMDGYDRGDFDKPWPLYRELKGSDHYSNEAVSLATELRRKRYEFRVLWRSPYHGSWNWGRPNVIVPGATVEGIYYATPADMREHFMTKKVSHKQRVTTQEVLDSELSIWSHWASGRAYGYIIKKPCVCCGQLKQIGSCWGYYEDPEDYPVTAAKEAIDNEDFDI